MDMNNEVMTCEFCKHKDKSDTDYPCNVCTHSYTNKFEQECNVCKDLKLSPTLNCSKYSYGKGDCVSVQSVTITAEYCPKCGAKL